MPQNLVDLSIAAPGFFGLNKQNAGDILPPGWATEAVNFVFDDLGRLAARKGTQYVNSTVISGTPAVKTVHEYINSSGESKTIIAAGNKLYSESSGVLTDITGSITITADHWQLINFNGNVVGFQQDHKPVIWKGTGSFTYLVDEHTDWAANTAYSLGDRVIPTASSTFYLVCSSAGTSHATTEPTWATSPANGDTIVDNGVTWTYVLIPSGNAGCAAGGLLWNLDNTTLSYSDLLIPWIWDTTYVKNQFDLATVWRNGMDTGVAVTEFNGYLAVFGKHSIVVYSGYWKQQTAGAVSVTGMSLVENLEGLGCLGRDTVQDIGNDVLFASNTGIRSLGRTIQEKSNPLSDVSKNVRDYIVGYLSGETASALKSAFYPKDGMYLISSPTNSKVFCFSTKQTMQDGSLRCTEWDMTAYSLHSALNNNLYIGLSGYFAKYTKYLDGISSSGTGGSTYQVEFRTGWHDFGQEVSGRLKIPKRMGVTCYGGNSQTVTLKWAYDYVDTFQTAAITVRAATVAEYGTAEYGVAEYSGGIEFNTIQTSVTQSGRIMKQGITCTINGRNFALHRINTQAKLGRLVL